MANLGYDVTQKALGLPTTAITATGVTAGLELDNRGTFRCQTVASAVTGTTPSFTLTVQTSHDNGVSDSWRTAGAAMAAVTANGTSAWNSFPGLDRWVRLSYAVSGTTPSFVVVVNAEAV